MSKQQHRVLSRDHLQRLDKWLAMCHPEYSRSQIQQWIAAGHVTRQLHEKDGASSVEYDAAKKIFEEDVYQLIVPPQQPMTLTPAPHIPLEILFEDADLMVINKQAGLTVHPGAGNQEQTLVNALLALRGHAGLSEMGGMLRPGIVHRLDKDTSGVMVVAKHDVSHHLLSTALAKREIKREYLAFCYGVLTPAIGTITGNIGRSPHHRTKMTVRQSGGKTAVTHYVTEKTFPPSQGFSGNGQSGRASLLRLRLETGRTHQIRVHLQHIRAPVMGDPVYGTSHAHALNRFSESVQEAIRTLARQALHATGLAFLHPITHAPMQFHAPLPADMQQLMHALSLSEQ